MQMVVIMKLYVKNRKALEFNHFSKNENGHLPFKSLTNSRSSSSLMERKSRSSSSETKYIIGQFYHQFNYLFGFFSSLVSLW